MGSDIRAGYKVENGRQVFQTEVSRGATGNFVQEAIGTVADIATVATAGTNPVNPGNLLSKTSSTQVIRAGKEAVEEAAEALRNPFKGKTLEQVQAGFEKQAEAGKVKHVYTDPVSGSKSYVNPKSKYSYNVDTGLSGKTGAKVEPPHVDVNYPNPKPKNVEPKRKFFFD